MIRNNAEVAASHLLRDVLVEYHVRRIGLLVRVPSEDPRGPERKGRRDGRKGRRDGGAIGSYRSVKLGRSLLSDFAGA